MFIFQGSIQQFSTNPFSADFLIQHSLQTVFHKESISIWFIGRNFSVANGLMIIRL